MKKLKCPHCGYEGGGRAGDAEMDLHGGQGSEGCVGFYLLEKVTVYRYIVGETPQGNVQVYGLYHTGEGYDEGEPGSYAFECRRCLGTFPVNREDEEDIVFV